jgi:hypothetical protein
LSDDPMPAELSPAGGRVEPRLVRGELPPPGRQIRKKKRSPWERHIELAREFPARWDAAEREWKGGWVECGVYTLKGDGPKARHKKRESDRRRIMFYVDRRFPLERFQVAMRCDPDTWCDLRLYIRFIQRFTPEEDARDRAQRRIRYDAMMARRAERAAERELERRRAGGGQG